MYKVLKKDGTIQDFDWKKVILGIVNSGASQEEADKVASQVELWLSTVAEDGMIKSYDLHMKVIDVLRGVNQEAAKRFEQYKKPQPQ
jgi:transcriptional regulator NrdR family protein